MLLGGTASKTCFGFDAAAELDEDVVETFCWGRGKKIPQPLIIKNPVTMATFRMTPSFRR
jgi:hypothetical protein